MQAPLPNGRPQNVLTNGYQPRAYIRDFTVCDIPADAIGFVAGSFASVVDIASVEGSRRN